jgi:hypothetical protein
MGMQPEGGTAVRESQSQNYLTTDGRTASLSWCQVTVWDALPDLIFSSIEIIFRQFRVSYYEVPSLTRGWARNLLV